MKVQRSELKMTQKGRQSCVRDAAGRGGAGSRRAHPGHEGTWHLLGSKLKRVKLESDGQF